MPIATTEGESIQRCDSSDDYAFCARDKVPGKNKMPDIFFPINRLPTWY
jgi:hypothetical protein